MISVKNVCKGYDGKNVLKDVSLEIKQGEIHGLIGENGAGKTTLINCIAGVYCTDLGSILYDNVPVYDTPETKLRVGYVTDSSEYMSYYSVRRLIGIYTIYYPGFNKQKFNDLNELFRIPVEKKVRALSKGQKMRLGFMLEVAKQPDYLILDEPTAGLDPVAKSKLMELLINEVEERNIGVLISSHNLADLEKICDVATIIEDGAVRNQGEIEELKTTLVKLQVVFNKPLDRKALEHCDIRKISNIGSVYTIVINNYNEEVEKLLCRLGAAEITELDMSLEEMFVVSEEKRGE